MSRLSLTDFVDIISASGTPKATKVAQIKNRKGYEPAFDFYKKIRDQITEVHRMNMSKSDIMNILSTLKDNKKITSYPYIVGGYTKWWGRKLLVWFDPPSDFFSSHGIDISVNPELGLKINGENHLIKLYFKAPKLAKTRIDIIIHLMDIVLSEKCPSNTIMSILDVRRSKLISPTVPIPNLSAALIAELAYISTLWPEV